MKNKSGEGKKMEALIDERYNVSDTKKYYSKINESVLTGLVVTTFNAFKDEKSSQVSHIRKDILEHLALQSDKYHIIKTFDDELNVWTVAVNEINLYGEGNTENEAVEDLIDSVINYASLFKEKADLFCKVESLDKLVFFIRILICQGDREKIKKLLGV